MDHDMLTARRGCLNAASQYESLRQLIQLPDAFKNEQVLHSADVCYLCNDIKRIIFIRDSPASSKVWYIKEYTSKQ